ncbi:MAG: DUF2619 domain-containing protein [Clostridia bacterium]|nr:DUF2619 domain-containing protein [Clostridia bacterium]
MNEINAVRGMAALRAVAGSLEVFAAVLMLHSGSVMHAMRINAFLALAGPAFLFAVSAVGLLGAASGLSPAKVLLIACGVALIYAGTR